MSNAIGLRSYVITIHPRDKPSSPAISFNDLGQNSHFWNELEDFFKNAGNSTVDDDLERRWDIKQLSTNHANELFGSINYGAFGFASRIADGKTGLTKYNRKPTDFEEVPLFTHLWWPAERKFALWSFQTFGIKSCVGLVQKAFRDQMRRSVPEYVVKIARLTPTHGPGGIYSDSLVKKLRFFKTVNPTDIADVHLRSERQKPVTFEVTVSTERADTFGRLSEVAKFKPRVLSGMFVDEESDFDRAVAEIRFGDRVRRVGIFGSHVDAGLIDITEDVHRGADGHPSEESLKEVSRSILKTFATTLQDSIQ